MRFKISTLLFMVSLFFMVSPAPAMMHGSQSGSQSSSQSQRDPCGVQSGEEQGGALWHSHGEYYHGHENGQVPHTHGQKGATSTPAGAGAKNSRQTAEGGHISTSKGGSTASTAAETTKKEEVPGAGATAPAESSGNNLTGMAAGPTLNWKDDMVMHRVPAGDLTRAQTSGSAEVRGFYMDETQVTNHQYVEFLNRVLSRIQIENGVVKGDEGQIWLLLGEVEDGYEPIVVENGRFVVNGPQHAACAVLRVTAYGASAYADFYGKRLPTEKEWFYAARTGESPPQQLPIPSPVVLYKPNDYGIRGLNSNIGEWGTRNGKGPAGKANGKEYVVMKGGSGNSAHSKNGETAIRRYPWEAFADVGFRTVVVIPEKPAAAEAKGTETRDGS